MAPPAADERSALLGYLAQARDAFHIVTYGLTDEQAAQAPAASELCIGGLVRHVTSVERYWVAIMQQRDLAEVDYEDNFRFGSDHTLAGVLAEYDACAKETEAAVADEPDLGRAVPVPKGVPWFPDDVDAWSVRWVLLHILQETARHAGHADIVRETIDGGTLYPLMAAVEGWPATEWLQPWTPAS
jgi:uncharacterized damage-inducible protein DinB